MLFSWLVGSSLNATGEPPSRRATPYSFYKHSTRLASRRADEPTSRRAAEPLNNIPYIPYSFYKHSTRLASRRADSNNRPQRMALYSVVPVFLSSIHLRRSYKLITVHQLTLQKLLYHVTHPNFSPSIMNMQSVNILPADFCCYDKRG